jgi:hypothetical protein
MRGIVLHIASALLWAAGFVGGAVSQGAFGWVWLSSVFAAIILSITIQWAADE